MNMKDIIIRREWIRRELYILITAVIIAIILNAVSIAIFNTRWIELITQLHVVVFLAVGIYLLHWLIRPLIILVIYLIKKIKTV